MCRILLLLLVAAGLGGCSLMSCGPQAERSDFVNTKSAIIMGQTVLPPSWSALDLPFYGGTLLFASEQRLAVSHTAELSFSAASAQWLSALVAAGWEPSSDVQSDKYRHILFRAATGESWALAIRGGEAPPYVRVTRREDRMRMVPAERIDAVFVDADFPYFGASIARAGAGYLQVSYNGHLHVEQLVALWPPALEALGWRVRHRTQFPDGGLSASFVMPDERICTLSITPVGSLWMVNLTITERPD